MIRTILIDDEKPSREALKNFLREYCQKVAIVAEADSMKKGLEVIRKFAPDLVFLDIEMPNGNGFDLLRSLDRITFKIIFITAHSEFAVRAFRFFASDYLLKPVDIHELKEAVEKVRVELEKDIHNRNLEELMHYINLREQDIRTIVIPDKKGYTVLEISSIIFCKADGYCTHFYLTDGREITSSKNLKVYDELLYHHGFHRVHNSYLVNLQMVRTIDHEGEINLLHNQTIPLGNVYKKRFLERVGGCKPV